MLLCSENIIISCAHDDITQHYSVRCRLNKNLFDMARLNILMKNIQSVHIAGTEYFYAYRRIGFKMILIEINVSIA